jgi:hypothetical protein
MNSNTADVIAGLTMLVGVCGIVVPVLPGVALIAVALLVWAILVGGWATWIAAVVALSVLALGQVLKYLLPGRKMSAAGVPGTTMLIGGIAAVAGFFLIPVVGVLIGFLLGVYVCELYRVRNWRAAWASTWIAMRAAGFSILIELATGLLAISIWAGTAILT